MTHVSSWLRARIPDPPDELLGDLAPEALDRRPGAVLQALRSAALERLEAARAKPGRVRESAFHLLAADALVSYACEAALEREDAEIALLEVAGECGVR